MKKDPKEIFWSDHYVRHNMRRLEHLASLHLPLNNRTVLELGAGIGDHSLFYLDRGCRVTALEGREENVTIANERFDNLSSSYGKGRICYHTFDLEKPEEEDSRLNIEPAEIVHCYGLLYHLHAPLPMLKWARQKCLDIMIVETALSPGDEEEVKRAREDHQQASQALREFGSRPTRKWVFNKLKRLFPYVYMPISQPAHEEFPVDWRASQLPDKGHKRGVFVASLRPLGNPLLCDFVPAHQNRG